MQVLPSSRLLDIFTTLPLACLSSEAFATTSIFTGKERDAESGNDYFGARYYSASMGRFMSPDYSGDDPEPIPYADFENPQSLNLYSFVHNNPLTGTDSDGHDCLETVTYTYTDTAGVSHTEYWGSHVTPGCNSIDLRGFVSGISNAAGKAVNLAQQAASQFKNIMNTPGGAGCMAKLAGTGALGGAGVGALEGLSGVAAGGVGVVVTEPGAIGLNAMGGAGAGLALGMTVCPGGAGSGGGGGGGGRKWKWGSHKSSQKAANQMAQRGWTDAQIDEAVDHGAQYPAPNNINPANGATRYVNPTTGRSVVIDNVTHEVLHVGGDGFLY